MSNTCQRQECTSDRILSIYARAKDMHEYTIHGETSDQGYANVFSNDSDTTNIDICLECGQVQGEFPYPPMFMEVDFDEESNYP